MLTRPRRPEDAGFTLPELIIAVSILGLVMSGLSIAVIGTLNINRDTGRRLDASRDAQLTGTYFPSDVEGADTTNGVVLAPTALCGGESAVVEFRGTTYNPDTPSTTRQALVAYVLRPVTYQGANAKALHRLVCEADAPVSAPITTPSQISDITVARYLSNASATVTGAAVQLTLTPAFGTATTLTATRRTT